VQRAEAAMVCDNDNMRARAADRNLKNDTARVLILEEGGRSSNIIADVEVNCRDYFQNADYNAQATPVPVYRTVRPSSGTTAARPIIIDLKRPPKLVKAVAPVRAAKGYYYSIKKSDTLYRIARDNCSSVQDIARLNGISDPAAIEIDQIIRLPAKKCNARN
jgi:LysM repeat protein